MEISGDNVNITFNEALWRMKVCGAVHDTRNGPALVLPEPLMVTTYHPTRRVLLNDVRAPNPYFHFMEGLWMLAGRRDVAWIRQFNSKIGDYSDDGVVFHGAYGHRWRKHFRTDQLNDVVEHLKKCPNSRRAVLEMWDASQDLNQEGLDFPCNTHIYLSIHEGALDMTVCNRSNDIIWGMFGANVVHMSMLQEYLAGMLGVDVGVMRQFSNNAHLYLEIGQGQELLNYIPNGVIDPYAAEEWTPYPMVEVPAAWDTDLADFMFEEYTNIVNPFFHDVAIPMYRSWMERKSKKGNGMNDALNIQDPAWAEACCQWIASKS